MSLPDYAKPSAGLIIRGVIPSNQSIFTIPGGYAGVYKVNAGNTSAPGSLSATLFLTPTLTSGADRQGFLIQPDGKFFTLDGKDSKWIGYVPDTRRVNGHYLSGDVTVNSGDIFETATALNTTDLNTLTSPGLFYQSANANATTARHYPTAQAGALRIEKDAGVTQTYTAYNGGGQWRRGYYNSAWSGWVAVYDTFNPPKTVDAYTKAQSDARYVTSFRLGSEYSKDYAGGSIQRANSGGVMTGLREEQGDNEIHAYYFRTLQFCIGSTWVNIGQI